MSTTHEAIIDFQYPEDEADPAAVNEYREASRHLLRLLNIQADFIVNSKSKGVAMWAVCYAIGLAVCEGVSISDRAAQLGVTPQALSKQMNQFRLAAGLPESEYCYQKGKG